MNAPGVVQSVILGGGVVLDQLAKRWAELELRPRGAMELVPGWLDLHYARNPGAFFSLGAGLPAELRRGLLVGGSLLALGLMFGLYRRARGQGLRIGICLLASGAIGNLIDRVRTGSVVDFVHLHAGSVLDWATFNLADVWITAGLLLLIVDALSPGPREREERVAAAAREGI